MRIAKVPIIRICAHRNARQDARVEFLWILIPLLLPVMLKYSVVKLWPCLCQCALLPVFRVFIHRSPFVQPRLGFVSRLQIHPGTLASSFDRPFNPVFVRHTLAKPLKVLPHPSCRV